MTSRIRKVLNFYAAGAILSSMFVTSQISKEAGRKYDEAKHHCAYCNITCTHCESSCGWLNDSHHRVMDHFPTKRSYQNHYLLKDDSFYIPLIGTIALLWPIFMPIMYTTWRDDCVY